MDSIAQDHSVASPRTSRLMGAGALLVPSALLLAGEIVAAALMLVGVTVLMAWQTRDSARAAWQYAAMAAGVLLSSALGWALLDSHSGTPTGDAPWLHRGVSLMVSSAMMTLLAGFGLGQILPSGSDWVDG